AYHQFDVEGAPQEKVVGGRYLDVIEKRGDEWKISSRVYVMDWNRNTPSAAIWEGGLYDQLKYRGLRFPDDLSRDYAGVGKKT
ncbi:MAG: nuclear transport factor 2 family protein, partial [Pseudomonadota bacterium]